MITREPEFHSKALNLRGQLGRAVLTGCRSAGIALLVLWEALLDLRFIFSKRSRLMVLEQLYITGIKSLG
ncbi:MAG: hypothetical protein WC299_09570, partial [Kiritimatiellia bacterium]